MQGFTRAKPEISLALGSLILHSDIQRRRSVEHGAISLARLLLCA
jgi:hypothetical protein